MPKNIDKILVPTDGSDGAKQAAAFAGVLARALNAKITVLAVNDDKVLALTTLMPSPASESTNVIAQEIKNTTEANVEEEALAETVRAIGANTNVETAQCWGHTSEKICHYAEENDFDLIVIGSRGLSTFGRALLGSVSSQIVHHAKCAVTVVR